jgi:hypothetical protein
VSNHAHRHPSEHVEEPLPPRPGFLRRLFGLGPATAPTGPVPVGFANSRPEAELMAGFLRNNGIKAVVLADDEGGLSPALQTSQRVRVLVPRAQQAKARKLIDNQE